MNRFFWNFNAESSGSSVYGYGSARHGQIGTQPSRHRRIINIPELILGFEDSRIVSLCANGHHSAALSGKSVLCSFLNDVNAYFYSSDNISCDHVYKILSNFIFQVSCPELHRVAIIG